MKHQLWFVQLANPPTADDSSPATMLADKTAFRANAKKAGLVYTERYAFNTLFNGFSISITPDQLGKLDRILGVTNIYPVEVIPMPEDTPTNPDQWTSITMIGVNNVQELGYTGAGIKMASMNLGIYYDHQALGGDGVECTNSTVFPTERVTYRIDFVGNAFNADSTSPSYNPLPIPDPYPDGCYGHGTHVAGIIGDNDPVTGLKGVAPDVTFGSYRAFGCLGSTTGDIMITAMERALADGLQVLNISISFAYQWTEYPAAMVASRLVNKGMVVVSSIGNNGANGLYSAGAPGVGDKVIGVASYDNSYVYLSYLTINDSNIGYITMTYSPGAPTSGEYEIGLVEPLNTVNPGCNPLPPGSLTGNVAPVARGT